MITWDEFRQDFKAHHIPQSVVESKREEFLNLKQGSLSVYQYNIMFQKLAHFAKQESLTRRARFISSEVASEKICN